MCSLVELECSQTTHVYNIEEKVWAFEKKINYLHGTVTGVSGTQVTVLTDRGTTLKHDLKTNKNLIVPDITPDVRCVNPGARVIADWKNDVPFYLATIVKEKEGLWNVRYDDNYVSDVAFAKLRLLPVQ